jgi:hypothetical protein
MKDVKYLVDNNALKDLGAARRKAKYFREHCCVSADVLYEARFSRDHAALSTLQVDMNAAALEFVRKIMATVPVGDTSLIDLYGNRGAADPGLIALALEAHDREQATLFPDTWIIVTNDKAVLGAAQDFGIETMTPSTLARLIDLES